MRNAHAVVAQGGGGVRFWRLTDRSVPTRAMSPHGMLVPMKSANATMENGVTVLAILGAKFPDPTSVPLLFASNENEWPARHNKRQGRTVVFSDKTTGLGDRSKDAELAKDAAGPGPYPAAMLAVAAVVAAFA